MENVPAAKLRIATFEVKVRVVYSDDTRIGKAIKQAEYDLMSVRRVRSVTPIGELEDPYKEAAPL